MPLEHGGDRLQVILGGNVHHRQVVVVEPAVRLGALLISRQQIAVELAVRIRMAGRIQRDERGELQKPGVDAAQVPRLALRDLVDRRQLEPSQGTAGGDAVDLGRVHARVDRAGHQRHGQRSGEVTRLRHQRDGRQHRNAGLADGDHVHVGADGVDEAHHQIHVVVQIEPSGGQRNQARVDPVREVEVVLRKQPRHRVAQQRSVMTGERRHQEDLRVPARAIPLEADQVAERRPIPDDFPHRDRPSSDDGAGQPEGRLRVSPGGALQ